MPPVDDGSPPSAPPATLAGRPLDGVRVLVTGATGFIGGHTAEALHRLGAEVHALHRSPGPALKSALEPVPVTWHRVDLADATSTIEAVAAARPHQIIHLASLVKGARDPELLLPMLESNVVGTAHLLEAARRAGVTRVQLAGSLEVPDPGQPPSSPYALSKAVAGLYGAYYRAAEWLEVIEMQIFMTYGPATPDRSKLVPYVVEQLLDGAGPELSSGTRQVDWVYVGDVAEGLARAALVDRAPEQPVPLGTGALHSIRQVVETLVELTGTEATPSFGSVEDRSNEVVRAADVERTRALLDGWAPSTSLRTGLAATVSWHRQQRQEPDGDGGVTGPSAGVGTERCTR